MESISVPSLKDLITNFRQARAIQGLYDYIYRWKREIDGNFAQIDVAIDNSTHYKDVYIGTGSTYSDAMIDDNHYDSLRMGATTSITASDEYLWVILPDTYNPTILMNGITVPMEQQNNITVEGVAYKVFKSDVEYTNVFNIILI